MSLKKKNAPKVQVDLRLTDSGLWKGSHVTAIEIDMDRTNLFVFRRWRSVAAIFTFFCCFAIQILFDRHEAGRTLAGDRGWTTIEALVLAWIALWYRPGLSPSRVCGVVQPGLHEGSVRYPVPSMSE